MATVPRPIAEVEGRMDLVLAVQDDEAGACLQVVDLKTTGCLAPYRPDDVRKGHGLQDLSAIGDDGRTQAEREELEHYALQLTLYSMALEAQEEGRPEAQRRTVLPPALLVAASGRMVEMTADEYDAYRAEAQHIMRWKAQLSADAAAVPATPCGGCCRTVQEALYRGGIRLCGPEGEDLGLYDGHRPAMTNVPGSPAARQVSTSSKPVAPGREPLCFRQGRHVDAHLLRPIEAVLMFGGTVHATTATGLEPGFTEGGEHGGGVVQVVQHLHGPSRRSDLLAPNREAAGGSDPQGQCAWPSRSSQVHRPPLRRGSRRASRH